MDEFKFDDYKMSIIRTVKNNGNVHIQIKVEVHDYTLYVMYIPGRIGWLNSIPSRYAFCYDIHRAAKLPDDVEKAKEIATQCIQDHIRERNQTAQNYVAKVETIPVTLKNPDLCNNQN